MNHENRARALEERLIDTLGRLMATVSLLEKGGRQAAPSNYMFRQMMVDCQKAIDTSNRVLRTKIVRVDFFKTGGKWQDTEYVPWTGPEGGDTLIHDAFRQTLEKHLQGRYQGSVAVCLEPCHEHSHPVRIVV